MTYIDQIENHLKRSGGIITASYCKKEGIPTVYLSRLVKKGRLRNIDRGIYVTEYGDHDDFYFFQYKYKKTVFSYETALYLQGLTDKIIQEMDVTVSSSYKFNESLSNVHVHYVKNEMLNLGVVEVETMFGNPVKVYSYERILCDFIAHKEKMDPEEYVKLVRNYSNYDNKNIQQLYKIAIKMGILSEVRNIMEVVNE